MKQITIILTLLFTLVLSACKSTKDNIAYPKPVIITNIDSVHTEYIERVTFDTVTVFVEVPAQTASVIARDSSHLETDFAVSDAWIDGEGKIYHDLRNKQQKRAAEVQVPRKDVENNNISIKEVPVPYPEPVYIDKPPTKWQQFRIDAFWVLVGVSILSMLYILHNIISAIKRH